MTTDDHNQAELQKALASSSPEKDDPFRELRGAIAHLSANELHRFSMWLYDHGVATSTSLCDALSHFATNSITEE